MSFLIAHTWSHKRSTIRQCRYTIIKLVVWIVMSRVDIQSSNNIRHMGRLILKSLVTQLNSFTILMPVMGIGYIVWVFLSLSEEMVIKCVTNPKYAIYCRNTYKIRILKKSGLNFCLMCTVLLPTSSKQFFSLFPNTDSL